MAKETKDKKTKRPTAEKRMIQNRKRRLENRTFKSQVRTSVRHLHDSLTKKDGTAKEKLNKVYSLLDKGVKHGIYKLNTASRTKSRLTARVAAAAS